MILTGYALQFWDKDKNPSIGIGDVRDMAAQLGLSMEYGLLLAQGEIRASQSVLESSLIDGEDPAVVDRAAGEEPETPPKRRRKKED